jgi:glycosyltransferase involved in cell wall biosynthesis
MTWKGRSRPDEDVPVGVVVVDDAMSATGSVRWASALVARWAAAGLSVSMFVLLDRRGVPLVAPPAGVAVTYGSRAGARRRRAVPQSLPGVARAVARADLALVVSEVGYSLPLTYLVCRVVGRPLVVMAQNVIDRSMSAWVPSRWRPLWRHCIRHADAVVCVSEGSAESVRRLGTPPARVSVVPSGVDADEVVRRARSAAPEVVGGDRRPVLVSCAELSAGKGHDLLLRALAAVRERGHPARLVILGEGPERAALERLAADLGIADSVQLPGFVANPYPEVLAADLFCLASRFEGLPLVLLEAMALGVPIVATDADGGGPRSMLAGGRLGDLVPPDSVEALTEAIVRHLDQPEALLARAAAGVAHARRFTPATMAAAYQEVFNGVLRRPAAAGDAAARPVRHTRR